MSQEQDTTASTTPLQVLPKIYTLQQIEQVTKLSTFQDDLIQGIANGFVARNDFCAAPIQTLGAPPDPPFSCCNDNNNTEYAAQTCVKSGYFANNNPYYVIKVASGGRPWKNAGLMQVYSQLSGRLEALLLDEGILTELRTAAFGALSVQLLGPHEITAIGMLGTGVQARYQLQMIKRVATCRKVLLYGRSRENAVQLQTELLETTGWTDVILVDQPDDLLQADVVITTTTARQAVLGTTMSATTTCPCRLLVCIGADAPGKKELADALVASPNVVLVADRPAQSRVRGEFQSVPASTAIQDFGTVITQTTNRGKSGVNQEEEKKKDRLVIVDSSGLALQDCVVAQMVYEALLAQEEQSKD